MRDCCHHKPTDKKCFRIGDKKVFRLPRKFSKEKCMISKGFSMRASCAPYKPCQFNVYVNRDPTNTIKIAYRTLEDVKKTISKLEKLYRTGKYSHQRIWQVGMILYVRLKPLKDKKPRHFELSKRYHKFLGERTKLKGEKRKRIKFDL